MMMMTMMMMMIIIINVQFIVRTNEDTATFNFV